MSSLFKQYKDAAPVPPETKEAIDEKKRIQKESLGEPEPVEEEPKSYSKRTKPIKIVPALEEDDKPYESTGMKAVNRISGLFKSGSKSIDKAMKDRYSKEVGKLPSGWSADQLDIIMANKRSNKGYTKRYTKGSSKQ